MKDLTALVLVIACVTGARLHGQTAAATPKSVAAAPKAVAAAPAKPAKKAKKEPAQKENKSPGLYRRPTVRTFRRHIIYPVGVVDAHGAAAVGAFRRQVAVMRGQPNVVALGRRSASAMVVPA